MPQTQQLSPVRDEILSFLTRRQHDICPTVPNTCQNKLEHSGRFWTLKRVMVWWASLNCASVLFCKHRTGGAQVSWVHWEGGCRATHTHTHFNVFLFTYFTTTLQSIVYVPLSYFSYSLIALHPPSCHSSCPSQITPFHSTHSPHFTSRSLIHWPLLNRRLARMWTYGPQV